MHVVVGLCVVAAAPWAALAGAAADDEAVATLAALASDEECTAAEDPGACALNALQLRGLRKLAEDEPAGKESVGTAGDDDETDGNETESDDEDEEKTDGNKEAAPAPAGDAAAEEADGPADAGGDEKEASERSTATLPPGVHGHPKAGVAYPKHEGFTLKLVEEFDEPLDLDSDPVWTWSDGGLIEGGIRFVKENVMFKDGKMIIEVQDRPATGAQSCSAAEGARLKQKKKTSGEMRARHNQFRYGRYEVRMKAPSVQPNNTRVNGNYVATMFVFRDGKDKHWREIDFELTGDSAGALTTNVLSADHTIQWKPYIQESVKHHLDVNPRADFHVYAFEWLPNSITWYVDGKKIRHFTGSHVKIPDLSGKIMMNTWMYDHRALFGGPQIKNNRFPMRTEYDWFRFYKWDGDTKYPCPGLGDSCLTQDDRYLAKNNPCDGITQQGMKFGRPACATHCR